MTDPTTEQGRVEHLDDHALLDAYERTSGDTGNHKAEALPGEIKRREIDV